MDLCNKGDVITPFDGKDPIFWVMDHRIQIHMYKAVLWVWIRIQSDQYIIGSSGNGSVYYIRIRIQQLKNWPQILTSWISFYFLKKLFEVFSKFFIYIKGIPSWSKEIWTKQEFFFD